MKWNLCVLLTLYFALSYNQQSLDMISNLPNIAINLEQCFMNNCERNCQITECELCATCWDDDDMRNLFEAHREHSRRGGFKRVFPSKTHFDENFIHKLSKENKISTRWFAAKCREDPEWCWKPAWDIFLSPIKTRLTQSKFWSRFLRENLFSASILSPKIKLTWFSFSSDSKRCKKSYKKVG